jgi:hypothetical protein
MAVNPILGPIPRKAIEDPNGPAGTTSGGVPSTESRTPEMKEPTAGSMAGLPPFLSNPTRDPLAETFAAPPGT